MKTEHKNEGNYAAYSYNGTVLVFRNGELTLDLARFQRDYPVNVTVSEDDAGNLVTGVSRRYVAEIAIPAKRKTAEKTGSVNPFGFPIIRRVHNQFNAEDVVLTLWAIN